ncbi:MAG: pantoate--beta-alanine ligase [Myxococcota bacterium]|nr:pantoate--beta-alanine ligase [Myxococcota bacterium]
MMEIIRDKAAMRTWSRARRAGGGEIGFVPTMGYLHEGHLSLVREARRRSDAVVVSIYVNPTQFAPTEDFGSYPRDSERDLQLLRELGCDAVFLPTDLYDGRSTETWVLPGDLASPLCGASRPGFFRGVATVVTKLFNIVEPDLAVFGQKDYQQLQVIQRMVRDLDLPVEIIPMPIVREADGLAMSSRNARLDPETRSLAQAMPQTLEVARRLVQGGESRVDIVRGAMRENLEASGARVDYVELVCPETLRAAEHLGAGAVAAIAAWYGDVRLIDNGLVTPPDPTLADA